MLSLIAWDGDDSASDRSAMFDLDAPIIPGESAAGLLIGQSVEAVLALETPKAVVALRGAIQYDFGAIHLWVTETSIFQIGLFAGYRGSMRGGIKIGSTIEQIQQAIGRVIEDEDDNLVVLGSPGWCFETDEWLEGHQPEQNPNARVREIYVFRTGFLRQADTARIADDGLLTTNDDESYAG